MNEARARWLTENVLSHEAAARSQLARRGESPSNIDDIVQQAYARLAATADVAQIKDAKAYFLQTVKSVAIQNHRRTASISFVELSFAKDGEPVCASPLPDQVLEGQQELQRCVALIGSFP